MPGVPRELMRMMDEQVLPRVARRTGASGQVVRATLLRTFGMGESALDAELADVARGSAHWRRDDARHADADGGAPDAAGAAHAADAARRAGPGPEAAASRRAGPGAAEPGA